MDSTHGGRGKVWKGGRGPEGAKTNGKEIDAADAAAPTAKSKGIDPSLLPTSAPPPASPAQPPAIGQPRASQAILASNTTTEQQARHAQRVRRRVGNEKVRTGQQKGSKEVTRE